MMQKCKRMFGSRFRAGGYAVIAGVIVTVIAVVVNLMVSSLPSSVTQIDMTTSGLFTLSEQTKQIVSAVNKDVDLYLLATTGNEDETIVNLLDRYSALNSRIHVSSVDPTVKPTFLESYDLSLNRLYANSVLVDCGGVYRLVGYDEIYVTETDFDYYTYNYTSTTSFNGEAELTSAIHYVTSDNLPKVYTLTGHGESELSDSVISMMSKDNMTSESLSLLSLDAVPEDATAVVIHAPTSDLSEDEAQLLIDYLNGGGHVILMSEYIEAGKMTNLLKVTQAMGLTAKTGLVMDGDRNHRLARYPHYLLPDGEEHEITSALLSAGYYIMVPMAQPIVETDDSAAEVTMLLTTSSSAYLKAEGMNTKTTEKADTDETGSFHVAAASELGEGKLLWIASGSFLDEQCDSMVSGANSNLFLNALNWMGDQEQAISIRSKSMDQATLTVPEGSSRFWSIIMIGIIPLAFVAVGIIVWVRRKRR